ncbi:zinc finger protein 414-like isoform X2 [Ambystoma mexicanum]|uniref:zinc finger protein 414-like isoform X2 n=1 Tax=Ambystoma mexicanum TaxID=8296 RepID=UPI0037E98E1F
MHRPEKTDSGESKAENHCTPSLEFIEICPSSGASEFRATKLEKEGIPPHPIINSKQFKCSSYGCKLAFNNMQQLLQHSRVHSKPIQSLAGKVFRCSTVGCKEVLSSMQDLLTHLKTHYKPNRYFKCENCMLRFRSYRSLFKHLHVCFEVSTKTSAQRVEKKKPNLVLAGGLETSVKPLLLEGLPKLQSVIIHPEKKAVFPDADHVTTATTSTRITFESLLDDELSALQNDILEPKNKLRLSPVTSPVPQTFSLLETSLFGSTTLPQLSGEAHSPTSEPFIPYGETSTYITSQANVQHRLKSYLPNQGLPVSNAVWKKNQGSSTNSRIVWEHTRGRYSCMQCPFSTTLRDEMTHHVKDHKKDQASRLQSEMGL